jgi:hypothetical protein
MFALLLCAALVFGLVGCAQEEKPAATPSETTAPSVTEPSAADLYAQAKAPLLEAANLELDIDVIKTVNLGGETFRLTSEQELTFAGLGTDQLQVSLEEDLEMEDSEDSFDEYYADGMLYVTVYDAYKFMGKMEQEEYLSAEQRQALLTDANEDAQWLIRVVENLLSITRLGAENTRLHKSVEAVEEVVEGAVTKFAKRYPHIKVKVLLPDEVMLVPMDPMLIQ